MQHSFLSDGGTLGTIIAGFDWSRTSLGPITAWPPHLKTTVGLILRSPTPIVMLWGTDGVMIYNDAYSEFAGARHPKLLGSKVLEGWPEVADFNANVMEVGLSGGTLSYRDQELPLSRNGVPEQVWMNLDYSPIVDESGKPDGVIAIVVETTSKVRAERWLSGERERLRQLFEQSPGFMALLTGEDHVFELVNPAYRQLIGHRDVLGQPVAQALPEIQGQGYLELLDTVFSSGEAFSGVALPVALQRSPGGPAEKRFVDFVYQPIRSESGGVIGIFVQGSDVTDRVAAEAATRNSEEQFRTFAQAMPNHVWAAAPDGNLNWFNERVYEYSGAADGELDGAAWTQIVHPDDIPAAADRWQSALLAGSTYEIQFRLRRADGAYRWHIARAVPIRDQGGNVLCWIGTNTDIEDQKATSDALARLNRTLEDEVAARTADRDRMWRLSTDIMLVARLDGTINAVNPAWTTLLGWQHADLVGTSFMSFVHADDVPATVAEVEKLATGLTTLRFENRYRHSDGSYRWLSWTAVPGERFLHAVGRDVTAEKEAQATLQQAEEALRQAQKMETVGQLTGGIAHDFNNLLQIVMGNLDILMRNLPEDSDRLKRAAQNAMTGAGRAATLTQRLLAFSRRQPLSPKALDSNRLLMEMSDLLHRTLGETINVETVLSPGLWTVEADPNQLENAILNLAVNARDAMPDGGKLTVETANTHIDREYVSHHVEVTAGQYVVICVTDTGIGMDEKTIAQAFEPFFTTKEVGKGTGLGLSMVYGFVKQSGGHVKVYSEPGEGTTVKIYLPRFIGDASGAEDLSTSLVPEAASGETILVCEDDAQVRAYSVEVLRELGYVVLEAADGPAALSLIEQRDTRVDLLFTDVVLPNGLSGAVLAQRAQTLRPGLKVLFTTGYARNAIIHNGRLDPGVELITKPFTHAALAERVRDLLDAEEARKPMD